MGMSKPSNSIFSPTVQCCTLTEIAMRNEAGESIKESLMKNQFSIELLYAQLFLRLCKQRLM